MAGLDVARNGLRAWAVTSGNEVIDRPYETWKDGIDKSFTPKVPTTSTGPSSKPRLFHVVLDTKTRR